MSARTRRLGWLAEMMGQVGAFAAVPAAIVLALALKPSTEVETGEARTTPLWHNASHTRICPACRLVSRQNSRELDVEREAARPTLSVDLAKLRVADGPESPAATTESAQAVSGRVTEPVAAPPTVSLRPILGIEPVPVL
jgi:hypothetical protein